MASTEARSGIFVPLPRELHTSLKVKAVQDNTTLQSLAASLLMAGLGRQGSPKAEGEEAPRRGRRTSKV